MVRWWLISARVRRRDVVVGEQERDDRTYFFADAICAWMPSIVFRWSSKVGRVLSIHAFRFGSTAPECMRRNSATSFLWSLTISLTYSRSKSAPCSLLRRSIIGFFLGALSSSFTPLFAASSISSLLALPWSSTI